MGETRFACGGRDFFAVNFARFAFAFGGVDEDDRFEAADAFRQFRRELVEAQDFDFCGGKLPFQRICGAPGHAIVGTQRISVGDDQDSRHDLERFQELAAWSSTSPDGLMSWMLSAMCPDA